MIARHEAQLRTALVGQPYPLLFVTVSGAHLYGFASTDSDFDLRGVHVLPLHAVVGLTEPRATVEHSEIRDGLDLDLVTHDARKFFKLLLRPNGYVLEQLFSPLVLHTTPEHDELKQIAEGCITRQHVHHYLGFARNQWTLFEKEEPRRVKHVLYVYRVLLTGIFLMRTGRVEANLVRLNEVFRLPQVDELIEAKRAGGERCALDSADLAFHRKQYDGLLDQLTQAHADSTLAEFPTGQAELDRMLVRVRMASRANGRA